MSLDIYFEEVKPCEVYWSNYTHNIGPMASKAGVYNCLWRPEENGIVHAKQLIPLLEEGIRRLESEPEMFIPLNPENGWGSYDTFLPWLRGVLEAARTHPNATVTASR